MFFSGAQFSDSPIFAYENNTLTQTMRSLTRRRTFFQSDRQRTLLGVVGSSSDDNELDSNHKLQVDERDKLHPDTDDSDPDFMKSKIVSSLPTFPALKNQVTLLIIESEMAINAFANF